jgi:hypothetical protein
MVKGRRFLVALLLTLCAAGGVAVSFAVGSGNQEGETTTTVTTTVTTTTTTHSTTTVTTTTTVPTTVTLTTTVASTTVTTGGGGASSSASSSSSSGGGTTGGQQQQQQQGGGGGGPVVVIVTGGNGGGGTTTAPFTPPNSTLAVARGSASVTRTANGWSVVVRFTASRRVLARACVLTSGVCVARFSGISVPGGSAAIALAVPASVGAGSHTIRVTFRAGSSVRTLFWPVFLS